MRELYLKYLKEREGLDFIELDHKGFVLYKLEDGHAFINDMYILPDYRGEKLSFKLADVVAKEAKDKGIDVLICQSDESANEHDLSRAVILKYGFKEYGQIGSVHHYMKGLHNG